jgi:hypothetical protein
MSMLVKVARYHLVQPYQYLIVTWGILAFTFAVSLAVLALTPGGHSAVLTADGLPTAASVRSTGSIASFFIFFFVLGVQSIGRSLPFGLTLGVSRRTFYAGTALLAAVLALADGLALTVLQAIERATDGWGVRMGFFRVPYLLNGPWYLTWLTTFVGLTLLYVYGMWFGIVYRRWNLIGVVAFIAAQVAVALAATVLMDLAFGSANVSKFFTDLTAAGLTGLLAVLAVALLAGGHATIRRATV